MGFPAGYTNVLLPNPLLSVLSLLGTLHTLALGLLSFLGLAARPDLARSPAAMIRSMLPAETLQVGSGRARGGRAFCAVCLCGYEEGEEIRRMRNCCHVFHRSCVDRWIDCDGKTCPLCRKGLVSEELESLFFIG